MVSVLLPVYNPDPRQLALAIDSILNQTFCKLELLILDDGGALPVELPRSSRIRYFRFTHRGLATTLNDGIRLAQFPWIARQDADDWSDSRRIERQLWFLWRHPNTSVLGTAGRLHQDDGRALWDAPMPKRVDAIGDTSPFFHGSTIFRRQTAMAVGGYDESLQSGQDREFFQRLVQLAPGRNLTDPLYHYRFRSVSITASRTADHAILAGHAPEVWHHYRKMIRTNPLRLSSWARLGRVGLFRVLE